MALSRIDTTNMIEDVPQSKLDNNINFRNLIINGSMDIAQRGTSFTGITSTKTYTLDRWFGRSLSSSSMSVSQSTDAPDTFLYSAKCQKPSGQSASVMRFEQPFETNNIVYLRGQKVTVSFYAKKGANYSPTNDAFPIALYSGNGTERARNITAFDNEALNINTSVTLTSTWQKFSVTSSTLPSDLSQLALQFQPTTTVTAGADESFFITGVQLEAGTTASDFEFLPHDVNLQRCHRYYETIVEASAGAKNFAMAGYYSSSSLYVPMRFKVQKRVTPSVDQVTGTNFYVRFSNNGADYFNSLLFARSGRDSGLLYTTATSGTSGSIADVSTNDSTSFIAMDAEL